MDNSISQFQSTLGIAFQHALSYQTSLASGPTGTIASYKDLRTELGQPLGERGLPPEEVVRELANAVAGGILGSSGPRFFGWVIGGCLPAAMAADWLTSAWDQNAVVYACAPAAAVVEEVAGAWLKEILGLPESASFAFVSGCQMAHVTCLAAARHALLEEAGWDVERNGLYGAPPIHILSSDQRHGSIERALRLLGMGNSQVIDLPTDPATRISCRDIERAFQDGISAPTVLLLQAGDINTGAFDDFASLIPLAKSYKAWVHVDGAFGLWASASPRHRHLTKGVVAADSWATDGHKWLNVPFDCGYAFVANGRAHRSALMHRAPYLTHDTVARNQMEWTPEWSRRARGFPTYAALRQLGRNGVAELIAGCCKHAASMVAQLSALPGVEVLAKPSINQGLVRFLDPRSGSSESDHDCRTRAVIEAVNATGEAFFTGTTWYGRQAMRISVCNWKTSEEDVKRTIRVFDRILRCEGV